MKKRMVGLMVAVLIVGALTGCSTKKECDFCGEKKRCETRSVWGQEMDCCEDCLDSMMSIFR